MAVRPRLARSILELPHYHPSPFYESSNHPEKIQLDCKLCTRFRARKGTSIDKLTESERFVFEDLTKRGLKPERIPGGSGHPDFRTNQGYCEAKAVEITPNQLRSMPRLEDVSIAFVPMSKVDGKRVLAGRILYVQASELLCRRLEATSPSQITERRPS